jgi:hypothetical protein
MKKNLFLRLCLIMIAMLSLNSCKQDSLQEEEESYNNSGAFQLKTNRISLNEAKHKTILLPELQKAEVGIKAFAKKNLQGKASYYGNGFSIDTDDVIYIENGPNYHTYTFKITRDNAPANALVENLVLTPLPDGSYKEFLVTYNLTESEKIKIQNDEFVDTKGKTQIVELSKANSTNILSKSESCSYQSVTINVSCASGEHMPGQSGCKLKGNDRAKSYSVIALVCSGSNDNEGVGPVDSGGGASSGGGGGGEPCADCPPATNTPEPCTTPQIPQGPVDPSFNIDPSGCGTGIPTQPSLPVRNNPCQKIKALVNNAALKIKIDSLKDFSLTAEENEKGYQQDKSGNVTPALVNGAHYVDFMIDQNSLGGIHCHTLNGTHMFSPPDILSLLTFARVQNQTLPVGSTADYTGNAFLGMISQSSSYFITFNGGSGDLPPPMTQAEEDALEIKLNDAYKKIIIELLEEEDKDSWDTLSEKGLQKLFFDLIKAMGLEGKINLIQQDGSNTSTIQQNPDGTIKEPIPC